MIYARFTPALKNVTTNPVTQWDYGRTLRIEGLELPTAIRIDFGLSGGQTTVSRIGITKDRVTDVVIPDSFLEQSNGIVAYVYVSDTTEGKTVRTINIPVKARAKPEEYDSPESKELFAEAIEMINEVAVRAENAANTAESCADTATAAVTAVNSSGAAQIQAIGKKGAEAVAEVETAKQESIAAVQAEGETQLQAIAEETAQIIADREQINSNTRNKAGAIVLDAQGESIAVTDASDCYLQGLKLFGKSTQDGTPTPDAPVDIVSVENPAIRFCGANLIPYPYTNSSKTESGVTFVDNGDGSITANGTAEISIGFWFIGRNEYMAVPSGKYAIYPYGVPTGTQIDVSLYDGANWNAVAKAVDVPVTFINSEEMCVCVRWYIPGGTVLNNVTVKAMLCKDYTDLDYEPPEAHQIISVPHTLHGILVSSGGNYTDADGQQWICDEVDLARGVYVQRIKTEQYNGDVYESWALHTAEGINQFYRHVDGIYHSVDKAAVFCDYYRPIVIGDRVGNYNAVYTSSTNICINTQEANSVSEWRAVLANRPIHVQYALATPIETPLSEAEINAFRSLHTNKPNTTVLNDAGAYMSVSYIADTKTYIDRQISALLSKTDET